MSVESVAKTVTVVINLILLFLPLISTMLTVGSTNGVIYTSEVGFARIGVPLRTLQVAQPINCMIECNALKGCLSFNVMTTNGSMNTLLCEAFHKSILLCEDTDNLKTMENSTYYESTKVPQISTAQKDCLYFAQSACLHDDPHNKRNGIYSLTTSDDEDITAVCDMETADGGWTFLQRRLDGSVDFYRNWESYKNGFGDLNGEFWLGLEKAYLLMKGSDIIMRFDMWKSDGDYRYCEYSGAMIGNEADNYRFSYDSSGGPAGDSMNLQSRNQMFSTKDRDNDGNINVNCAVKSYGAWWYDNCHRSNLNGKYDGATPDERTMWVSMTGWYQNLPRTEIKFKRTDTISY